MEQRAFQDNYPDEFSHCYGCGRLNEKGLQLKSYWDGEESIAHFMPEDYHISIPGFVYGGLIASLIDCHCVGTAAAASRRQLGTDVEKLKGLRFVTASLQVDFKAPTPLGRKLEIRAKVTQITEKKVTLDAQLKAGEKVCATGRVVAVRIPDNMKFTVK